MEMDATQALRDTENSLRDFIADRLEKMLGPTWEDQLGVSPEKVAKWRNRREEERTRLRGAGIEERLLYYSDFYDISTILRKHWSHFQDALLELKAVEMWLSELERYRDSDAHRRELFTYQKHLILGISGEIRARLVRFRSKMDDIDSHFPRIEAARDSLGATWIPGRGAVFSTPSTVRVADTIEFVVTATDPVGETIDFGYRIHPSGGAAWGLPNCFQYTFQEGDIGKRKEFMVLIRSPRPNHAHSHFDDMAIFLYHILPSK
jgi:HEPN superfamily Swt1-like protein